MPPEVAVVVYDARKLLAVILAFASLDDNVLAVAALATPVPVGNPVKTGVNSVGVSLNTARPPPVSSLIAPRRFALDGVARNVATPVPKPDMPVLTGKPVQFVSVPLVGVPSNGATNVGEVPKLVSDDAVTPDARVAPVKVPAAAVTVIFAEPSKLVPLMVRGVVNVAALPVVF